MYAADNEIVWGKLSESLGRRALLCIFTSALCALNSDRAVISFIFEIDD